MLRPLLLFLVTVLSLRAEDQWEMPPISYSDTAASDAITRLQARLNARAVLFGGRERDVVEAVLKELGIPVSSQMLVWSKTSLQRSRISPETPRALYFSDDCYVGWVPGGMVEVAAIEPQLGPVFYTFDPLERGKEPQRFRRDVNCLSCHANTFSRDIPGVFARSIFAESSGSPIFRGGSELVDHTTPFAERWGGWYVTGRHGTARHRGNAFAREEGEEVVIDAEAGANREDLGTFFDTSAYPVPSSDIVALMIFEHQLAAHQALTRANHNARRMLHYQRGLQASMKEPVTSEPAYDSVKSVFRHTVEDVLDVLLYREEASLPEGGIQGSPAFRAAWEAGGPRTATGKSLRQIDAASRLMRLRCSPLIYSEQFRALPEPLLRMITARLGEVLKAPDKRYAYLPAEERQEIAAILRETAPELTAGW